MSKIYVNSSNLLILYSFQPFWKSRLPSSNNATATVQPPHWDPYYGKNNFDKELKPSENYVQFKETGASIYFKMRKQDDSPEKNEEIAKQKIHGDIHATSSYIQVVSIKFHNQMCINYLVKS